MSFRRHRLGRTPVEIPELAFGAAPIAGLYEAVPADEGRATIRRALDRGLSYVDTAPHYNLGRSEELLSTVLPGEPRDSYVISTKVGRWLRPLRPGEEPERQGFADPPALARVWDWSRDGIRRSLEQSLERLKIDRADIVYLHDPDDHEQEVYATGFPALAELRDEGVLRAVGAGMSDTEMLTRFVRRLDLDVVLCAGRYTLLDRSAARELLPVCRDRGTSVVVGGAYNSGLLADPRPGATYDYVRAPERLVARAVALREVCGSYGVPIRAAALRFPLNDPAVAGVLVGCRSPAEVDDNAEMFARPIPTALWAALQEIPV